MIYKIKIDTRKIINPLNELGITTVDQDNLFFFVNAENPDDACHIALNKLKTKIIEEELKELENFQQTINTITFQLGQLSLRKLNLESEENNLKNQYSSLLQTEKKLGDKLKEKYGDSQIDLKTGELIQSE